MVTYAVNDSAEYLAVLDDDWRRDTLMALRALIQRTAPEREETINYKMLEYGDSIKAVGFDQDQCAAAEL